ncbi:uncharacterized protein LOC119599334 [Penaeus monodon]|uniref:uncharacterized protein LOC119599334 n=1 Tax=Penaeus monodon TaxID=6687 RepID=UPI0018A759EF|nr:uncharacterized protein LOC119599334 [Penaeus monodon]
MRRRATWAAACPPSSCATACDSARTAPTSGTASGSTAPPGSSKSGTGRASGRPCAARAGRRNGATSSAPSSAPTSPSTRTSCVWWSPRAARGYAWPPNASPLAHTPLQFVLNMECRSSDKLVHLECEHHGNFDAGAGAS